MCKKPTHLAFNPAISSTPLQGVGATKRGLVDERDLVPPSSLSAVTWLPLNNFSQYAHVRTASHFHSPSCEPFVIIDFKITPMTMHFRCSICASYQGHLCPFSCFRNFCLSCRGTRERKRICFSWELGTGFPFMSVLDIRDMLQS